MSPPTPDSVHDQKRSELAAANRQAVRGATTPRVVSADLFKGAQELEVVHGRDVYRLRITSLGRLILTK